MSKTMRKGIVLAAVFALLLAVVRPEAAYGAPGIDLTETCSISFVLDGTYEELHEMELSVMLYQVADVKESGVFEARAGYTAIAEDLASVDDKTTAEEWQKMAESASEAVMANGETPVKVQMTEGQGTAADLSAGLYLVMVEPVEAAVYSYTFAPYLVALPGNSYAETGSDEWEYDVEARLKPDRADLYGNLTIEKQLDAYNVTLGGATFIFQVEAVKDQTKVYSDVVSIMFDGAGTKSVEVGPIPAGADVTVTEVYSGAGYQAVSGTVQQAKIAAVDSMEPQAKVTFQNTYDGRLNGGSGVVNHFVYEEDGTWNWEQQ